MSRIAKPKHHFAAIPARAYVDRTIDGRPRDVLGVIALFDRMSLTTGGQGCWATSDKIAHILGTSAPRVRACASLLENKGYIRSEPMATDRRKRTFRVIYDDEADWAVVTVKSVSPAVQTDPEICITEPQNLYHGRAPNIDSYGVEEIARIASPSPPGPAPWSVPDVPRKHSAEAATRPKDARLTVLSGGLSKDEPDPERNQATEWFRRMDQFLRDAENHTFTDAELERVAELRDDADEWHHFWQGEGDQSLAGWARRISYALENIIEEAEAPAEPPEEAGRHNTDARFIRQVEGWLNDPNRPVAQPREVPTMRRWLERMELILDAWVGTNDQLSGWAHGVRDALEAAIWDAEHAEARTL